MMATTIPVGQQSLVRGCQASARSQGRSAGRVQCSAFANQRQQQQQPIVPDLKQLAVGFAAAVLVSSAPAQAGVILQKSNLKKVFQSDETPAPVVKKAPAQVGPGIAGPAPSLPSLSAPSLPSLSAPSLGGGEGVALLALPLAIGGLAGVGFLWSKIDPGFGQFFDDALCKNSNNDGAGYEFGMKSGNLPKTKKGGSGTKKIAKKAAKKGEQTKKKGLLSF